MTLKQRVSQLNINWTSFIGVLFFFIVLAALFNIYGRVTGWLRSEQDAPIKQLQIQGQHLHVKENDVRRQLNQMALGSFFTADVEKVRTSVQSLPWVYSATIRKQWPDTLKIHIVEQQAKAQWNETQLLNQYGEVFTASLLAGETLPQLQGPKDSEKKALKLLEDFQALLSLNDYQIQQLELSQRYAISLQLDSGIQLKLGRISAIERLQRFIDLYPLIQKQQKKKEIQFIDLRYDTGFAVRWRENTKENQRKSKLG